MGAKAPRARRTKSVDRIDRYFETAAKEAPEPELDVELIIPTPPKLANRVIELKDVGVELGGRTLFQRRESRISRLANASASSAATGSEKDPAPEDHPAGPAGAAARWRSARGRRSITSTRTVLLSMTRRRFGRKSDGERDVAPRRREHHSSRLSARFLFNEDRINTKIAQLSGGERSRVILAKILKRGGNVLILDEPTNDLDLGTLRLLEEALVAFEGASSWSATTVIS